jgi:von Willebrand factor type A domain
MTQTRTSTLVATLAVGIASIAVACSSDRSDFAGSNGPTGFDNTDAGLQSPLDAANACASETQAAEQVPLAMLLVMDRSGSMTTDNRWDQARNAMVGFADSPAVLATKLGLTIFPPDTGDQCLSKSYAPIVPISPLPGAAVKIKAELMARSPNGGTPMGSALQGGVEVMNAHLTANPNEEGVIILVTDGDPGGCSGDGVATVAKIAELAAKSKPPIRTFVVGMDGATFTNLDIIAKAGGGAPKAFTASKGAPGGQSPQQQLLDALQKIRSGAIGCEYVLPVPDTTKGVLALDSVIVNFSPGNDEPEVGFRRVWSEADCSQATGGFYYDDNDAPKRIILCSASCDDVRSASANGKVDVLLGCIYEPK